MSLGIAWSIYVVSFSLISRCGNSYCALIVKNIKFCRFNAHKLVFSGATFSPQIHCQHKHTHSTQCHMQMQSHICIYWKFVLGDRRSKLIGIFTLHQTTPTRGLCCYIACMRNGEECMQIDLIETMKTYCAWITCFLRPLKTFWCVSRLDFWLPIFKMERIEREMWKTEVFVCNVCRNKSLFGGPRWLNHIQWTFNFFCWNITRFSSLPFADCETQRSVCTVWAHRLLFLLLSQTLTYSSFDAKVPNRFTSVYSKRLHIHCELSSIDQRSLEQMPNKRTQKSIFFPFIIWMNYCEK